VSWTENDVNAIIGQSESIRREFKSGRMFDDKESQWSQKIAMEVSALANTEGGELFLGIEEDRQSKPRVAISIDGASSALEPERLQQLIEGNVSPYLPGLRAGKHRLSSDDGRYYGRSEFKVQFLPDHEVRLRMSRGKVARGTVNVHLPRVALGFGEESRIRNEYQAAVQSWDTDNPEIITPQDQLRLIQASQIPDKLTFRFAFRNDGEITIRAPVVEFSELRSERFSGHQLAASIPARVNMDGQAIYPGDERIIGNSDPWLECRRELSLEPGDCSVRWKVFLDNSPPSYGTIDLGILIRNARSEGS
jgi:hypothetical protein